MGSTLDYPNVGNFHSHPPNYASRGSLGLRENTDEHEDWPGTGGGRSALVTELIDREEEVLALLKRKSTITQRNFSKSRLLSDKSLVLKTLLIMYLETAWEAKLQPQLQPG